MKKRNWTLICLAAGIACFGVFGVYNGIARSKGTFELEDIFGDRAHLADFPLEGYAGDNRNTVEFTIIDGEVEMKHHSYDIDAMENIRTAREIGRSEFAAYFANMWDGEGSNAETEAVPTKDAKLKHKDVPSIDKFEQYAENYKYGETITADKADIYVRIYQSLEDKVRTARFPSGLALTESILYTGAATAESGSRTEAYENSYRRGFLGEEYDAHTLKSYSADIGDTVYAVVAPDERCEGTTYIYKMETVEEDLPRVHEEVSLEEYITDRSTEGKAEPFLPVPDPAERKIVGLQGMADKYLAVFLTEGDNFIAEIYDTEGKLIGSAKKTLSNALEGATEHKGATIKEYLRANRVDFFYVPWEEGVSLSLAVTDRVIFTENVGDSYNEQGEQDDTHDDVTGRLLLWITPDGVEQSAYDEYAEILAIRGDKILKLSSITAPEKEDLKQIADVYMPETKQIEVLDGKTFGLLYQGILKTDFWQDAFRQLTKVDNSGTGAVREPLNYNDPTSGWMRERAVVKLQPIGGRSEDRW